MSKIPVDGYSLLSSLENSNPTPLAWEWMKIVPYSRPASILVRRGPGGRSYPWTARRETMITEAWQKSRAGKWVIKERETEWMYTCRDATDKDGIDQ